MDKLWRLMTAIFMIAAGVGLFVVGYFLGGGPYFSSIPAALLMYACLILIPAGIIKGLIVIREYHKGNESEE